MKTIAVAMFVALFSAFALLAAEEAKPEQKAGEESKLVDAAKKSKTSRKKSTSKVLTNADVKKSKGVLMTNDKPAPPPVKTSTVGPITQHEADRKLRQAAEETVAAEEKKVELLERELVRIEQAYYDESDPNFRDDVIQKQFEQARRQLEAARQTLVDARTSLDRLSAPRP